MSVSLSFSFSDMTMSSLYLNILIRHSDVISIGGQIFWRCHHSELNGSLVSESLVCPFSHRSDLFDSRNTVVRNENLKSVQSATTPNFDSFPTHGCDDGVAIALCYKFLDSARRRSAQLVPSDKMCGQVMLVLPRSRGTGFVAIHAVGCRSHD